MEKEASLKERPKAILLLAATATMWSLGGLLIKSIEAHALAIAGMRSVISAAIIVIATGKPKINWSAAQIGAAFAYAGMVILFVAATKNTTAANAILIQYTAPVYVIFLSEIEGKSRSQCRDELDDLVARYGIKSMAFVFIVNPDDFMKEIGYELLDKRGDEVKPVVEDEEDVIIDADDEGEEEKMTVALILLVN